MWKFPRKQQSTFSTFHPPFCLCRSSTQVNSSDAQICQYKVAELEGFYNLANDPAKINEKIQQSLRKVPVTDRITAVQSFDKILVLGTFSGEIQIINFATQQQLALEKVHYSVSSN
jgi:hypothetical protein